MRTVNQLRAIASALAISTSLSLALSAVAATVPEPSESTAAQVQGMLARDLTAVQVSIQQVQAPPTAAIDKALDVKIWVDRPEQTYALGENVRIFLKPNKDAFITVLAVGPTGTAAQIFPNAHQSQNAVKAGQTQEILPEGSLARVTVSGQTGAELIKVLASTQPTPPLRDDQLAAAGPFRSARSAGPDLARDLTVAMAQPMMQPGSQAAPVPEWATKTSVIKTVATLGSIPAASVSTAVAPAPTPAVRISTDRPAYRIGESVQVSVMTPTSCFLTLVNITAQGAARVLFPNRMQPNHFIQGGQTVTVPGLFPELALRAVGPAGQEQLIAMCSPSSQPLVQVQRADGEPFDMVADASQVRQLALTTSPTPGSTIPAGTLLTSTSFVVTP